MNNENKVDMKKRKFKKAPKKALRKTDVSRFSFAERDPEIGAYISLVWEDGSNFECIYNGLDKSIVPLPTHWYYVK